MRKMCKNCLHFDHCINIPSYPVTNNTIACDDWLSKDKYVPVVHGEWLPTNDENKKRCSRCDVIHLIAQYPAVGANLCPACGAKMGEEIREERGEKIQIYGKMRKMTVNRNDSIDSRNYAFIALQALNTDTPEEEQRDPALPEDDNIMEEKEDELMDPTTIHAPADRKASEWQSAQTAEQTPEGFDAVGRLYQLKDEREKPANLSGKIILDLCGGSGSWSRFYKEAGYDVRVITLPEYDVTTYTPPENVYGILAAPPCTEFSVLNCKAEARNRKPEKGMVVVSACLKIIAMCKPKWWALENPRGFLREYLGKPTMTFQPWQYGDPWTKTTDIWGSFTVPPVLYRTWDEVPNKLPLYTRPNRGKPNFAFLHKSEIKKIPQLAWANPQTDADFRAITPPGFAKAFFEANHDEISPDPEVEA